MKNNKLIYLLSLLLFFIAGTGVIVSFFIREDRQEYSGIPEKVLSQQDQLKSFINSLSYVWTEGEIVYDFEHNPKCLSLVEKSKKYGQRILQCNPDFLGCLLENEDFIQKTIDSESKLDILKNLSPVHFLDYPEVQTYGYKLEFSLNKNKGKVIFPSLCHELSVPQRHYPLNASQEDFSSGWDNFNQNIFVDRYQVTNKDLKVWAKLSESAEVQALVDKLTSSQSLYRQATGLKASHMKNFCSFFGKQVLTSQVLDAMSFRPRDIRNDRPGRFRLSPYPWSTRERSGFLYKIKQGREEKPDRDECLKVFTKECFTDEKTRDFLSHPLSATWSGLFQSLGGFPEYVRNPYRPRDNLRASSFYFDASSSWHRLGARAYWDGEDFDQRNFNWRFEPPDLEDEIEVSFRCMRWVKDR